jgi:hypothetical protein
VAVARPWRGPTARIDAFARRVGSSRSVRIDTYARSLHVPSSSHRRCAWRPAAGVAGDGEGPEQPADPAEQQQAGSRAGERESDQRPGQQLQLPLLRHSGGSKSARCQPAGPGIRRPADPDQPQRQDRHRARLSGRTLRAGAGGWDRAAEHTLAGLLPQPELLRRCERPGVRVAHRDSPLDGRRSHRPPGMARPSHPLDVPGLAAAGQGQGQAHEDLQLAGADRSGRAAGHGEWRALWTPAHTAAPAAAVPVLVALVVLGLLFVLFMRRRRSGPQAGGGPGVAPDPESVAGLDKPARPTKEAW